VAESVADKDAGGNLKGWRRTMLAYYQEAVSRSWVGAWEWATGQGIYLTWLLGFCVLTCAVVFAVFRAIRKHHSWRNAMNDARKAVQDFFLAMVVSSIVVLTILFMGFFVRDAPVQIALAKDAIRSLKTDNAKAIEQLNATIADLQSKLDDRDAQRQERTKQQHVHDERVNILATLILQANQIAKDFEEKDDKDAIQTQYRAWERRTLEALSSKFDVSYLSQFGSARGTGLALMGHNYEGGGWYSLLQGKLNVLNAFLAELRKQ